MHLGVNIGSLPFEGELLDTNSGDPVNIALPKLQRETNSASTPASKLLSDYTIAEVENNSNRINESVLKEDFYKTLDKKCQEEHHQNFEELSKQSLKNALEFQGRVYQDFTKEKAKLSEKKLVSTDRYKHPCIVTDCSFTHKSIAVLRAHLFKHTKVSQHYCEQCFPNIFFVRDKTVLNVHIRSKHSTDSTSTPASKLLSDYTIAEVENNSNRIDESVLKEDFYKTLDKKCQEEHHQNFEELSKQSLKNALEFQGRVYQDFTKEKAKLFEKKLVSTDRYEHPCIVTDCAFTHIKKGVVQAHFFKHTKVSQHYCEQCFPNIFFARDITSLNKHISRKHSTDSTLSKYGAKRICPPDQNTINFFRECNVSQVSNQQKTDSASTPASKLLSDNTIAEVENNSNRIDEGVLKEDFYNTLDKKCQEEYHQNFEELSKQSLKKALEFQDRVYQDFTKEKVKLSKKQLVSTVTAQNLVGNFTETPQQPSKINTDFPENAFLPPNFEQLPSTDRYEHPCIVTDCAFTHRHRAIIKKHLFKHIKVSPHYCEQCFPNMFFARDKTDLDKHKRSVHCLDKVISKRGIKRTHQCVQNTINGSNGFTVNQESDQQKTDSPSTPASKLLFDNTIAQVENNSNRIDESVLKVSHSR